MTCSDADRPRRTVYASSSFFDLPQPRVALLVSHPHSHEQHPVSTPISLFENVICMAISLALVVEKKSRISSPHQGRC